MVVKNMTDQISEATDDDLRAIAALAVERMGHADNLTMGYLLPKSQVARVMTEGSQDAYLALWLYLNDVNSPNPKDRSGWDKVVSRVGNPCVVKTAPINQFAGRALAGQFDGLADGLDSPDHADFQLASLTNGLSLSTWLYPLDDTPLVGANPYAIRMATNNDILTIPHRTAIDNFASFTISFWFYPEVIDYVGGPLIIEKGYNNNNNFVCYMNNVNNTFTFRTTNSTGVQVVTAYILPSLNKWYHIVLRYNSTGGLQELIVDNVIRASGTQTSLTAGVTADLKFNSRSGGTSSRFCYDEIRIWRRALSDEEIGLVYNGIDISGTPVVDSEVHHSFTEGSGTSSVDEYSASTISITGTWVDPSTYLNPDGTQGHFKPKKFRRVYAKRDDASNHLVAYLNSIDKSIGVQVKKAGSMIYKKSEGDNNVLWFDGVNDYLTCGVQSDLWSNTNKTKFSFSLWFNPSISGDTFFRTLVNHAWGSNYAWTLYMNNTTDQLVWAASAVWPNQMGGCATTMGQLPMGKWYHVVCVYDKDLAHDNMKMYINGVLLADTNDLIQTFTNTGGLTISIDTSDYKGYCKDFRYWNRAISQAEVSAIYAGTDDETMTPDYWLKMDEGTGTTLNDLVGGKTATLINGPAWRKRIENQLITLDGINDYIDLGTQTTFYWSSNLTKFSFSYWIKSEALLTADKFVVDHGWSGAGAFLSYLHNASQRISFHVCRPSDLVIVGAATANNSYVANQWLNVVCVFDSTLGSANLKIYVNGVIGSQTGNCAEALNVPNTTLKIGASGASTPNAKIKDFRWWTTKALTAAEALKLSNGTDTYDMRPDYWLPMDEGSGNPNDIISGSKTGALTNGAAWVDESNPSRLPTVIYNKLHLPAQFYRAYQVGKWGFIVVEYNPTGDVVTVFSKGSQFPTVATGAKLQEPTDALVHLSYSGPTSGGYVYSYIAQRNLKWWKKLLTKVEVNNEERNKFSISNLKVTEIPLVGFATVSP